MVNSLQQVSNLIYSNASRIGSPVLDLRADFMILLDLRSGNLYRLDLRKGIVLGGLYILRPTSVCGLTLFC